MATLREPSVPNLWDPKRAPKDSFDQLVYASNLLGSDLRVTNFGGGNTSLKRTEIDPLTGEEVDVLWVKGSGGDLGSAKASNFASLYLNKVLALEQKFVSGTPEDDLVPLYSHCTFNLNPTPCSIDTPLHAFVPDPCVSHLHADADARRGRPPHGPVVGVGLVAPEGIDRRLAEPRVIRGLREVVEELLARVEPRGLGVQDRQAGRGEHARSPLGHEEVEVRRRDVVEVRAVEAAVLELAAGQPVHVHRGGDDGGDAGVVHGGVERLGVASHGEQVPPRPVLPGVEVEAEGAVVVRLDLVDLGAQQHLPPRLVQLRREGARGEAEPGGGIL
ncbi:MAG: hypothetical protein EDM74_10785, partial [Armatimonadetes bacterium]